MVAAPPPSSEPLTATPLTTLHRRAGRGSHERAVVNAILDEALVCHVAVVVGDQPCTLPMAHVRVGERLYVHGARANRVLGALAAGGRACVTVTLLDGLVFGESWFHHSMNYRCAVLYGAGAEVSDEGEKRAALTALVDRVAPGRSAEARPPTAEEMDATLVVRFPIDEASAKARSGPPLDEPDAGDGACWTGVLPLALAPRLPVADPARPAEIPLSAAVATRARLLGGQQTPGVAYERSRGPYVVSTDPARVDFAFVQAFLAGESYWARGVPAHQNATALAHSLCFGAYEGSTQVGFARVVTDYARIVYLADVFVTPSARGKGLGKWMVECILAHPELARVPRWLLGTADAHALYDRYGFVRADAGRYMVRATPGPGAR